MRAGLRRLIGAVLLAAGATAIAVPTAAAQEPPAGTVLVIPGQATDLTAIRLRTSAGCPAQADAYYARLTGAGFPDGLLVTTNVSAGISRTSGFDVYFEQTMRDFADLSGGVVLGGRYDITVACIDAFRQTEFATFTGALEFTTPTAYAALGAALPVGPPPEPLRIGEVGSAAQVGPLSQGAPAAGPGQPGPGGSATSDGAVGSTADDGPGALPTVLLTVLVCVPLAFAAANLAARRRSP